MIILNSCGGGSGGSDTVLSTTNSNGVPQAKPESKSDHEVTNAIINRDGCGKNGLSSSCTRNDKKEIVTDHITGLQWQDNLEYYTQEKPWKEAQIHCASLSLDGGGWRLPTVKELQSIVINAQFITSRTTVFKNYRFSSHWSSTTYTDDPSSSAWGVYFHSIPGTSNGYTTIQDKRVYYPFRCVRYNKLNSQ